MARIDRYIRKKLGTTLGGMSLAENPGIRPASPSIRHNPFLPQKESNPSFQKRGHHSRVPASFDWVALGRLAALRGEDFSANPFRAKLASQKFDEWDAWFSHQWFCGWFDAQDILEQKRKR